MPRIWRACPTGGFSRAKSNGLRGLRVRGLRIGAFELAISRPRDPLMLRLRLWIRILREEMMQNAPR
eukprot:581336-Alexandrium_andersonii.AAC.1